MPTAAPPEAAKAAADPRRTLDDDVKLLDDLLGRVIRRQAGEETLALLHEVQAAALGLRANPSVADARRLRDRLDALDLPQLRTLIRAFSVYFDLINLAEQHARVRAIRHRITRTAPKAMTDGVEDGLRRLKDKGVTAAEIDDLLRNALVVPVFTAHPSEARRLTVLEKLTAVSQTLDTLEYTSLLPRERENAVASLADQIETFWMTDTVREKRPTVLDEVRQGLEVFGGSLFGEVPRLYADLEAALKLVYPDHAWDVPSLLRFGSWIGGDRDGNPFVTHAVTAQTVRVHQEAVLKHYVAEVTALGQHLSHSTGFVTPSAAFRDGLEHDAGEFPEFAVQMSREPYRGKCRAIAARLGKTLDHVRSLDARWADAPPEVPAGVYSTKEALVADLAAIADDLSRNKADAAVGRVKELIRAVDVFGLHLLTLDVRQHADRHRSAVAEVLKWANVCPDYDTLSPDEAFAVLAKELAHNRPLVPAHLPFSADTTEVILTFRSIATVLESQCPEAINTYIISGTGDAAHLLEVLLFAREARLYQPDAGVSRLNIVPLFEALDPLRQGTAILDALIALPAYRKHLELRGNLQEVMIGYSDSNKESGFVQSAWALYRVQRDLADLSKRTGVRVQVFHGRGGAVGRGGGPANRAILAQPRGTINGRLKITEQGEMIADRYGTPAIAQRHLDQVLNAVLRASLADDEGAVDAGWERLVDDIAERARKQYRSLVYDTPGFIDYFQGATPIAEVSQLKIGSRPARRGGSMKIENLRAIPWVFSWMQSRHTLPGWFGLGTAVGGLLQADPGALPLLRAMYKGWHFWATLVDNAQMILAKADMTIARLYADLIEDQTLADAVFTRVASEYQLTAAVICSMTGQKALLENAPILQTSIQRRNPFVDPLSFLQMVLLRRMRAGTGERDGLLKGVLESINGVSAGLKNTG